MQPQAPSPNPNLDFILKNGQPAKKGFKLPTAGLPKLAVRILAGVFILAVLVVIYSIIAGRGGSSSQDYVNALARGQEIIRVSTSVATLSTDSQTQNLAATTQNTLASEQAQLTSYLTTQKLKVGDAALNVDKNSATDTQMQTASTNGNLSSVYTSYLKAQLQKYRTDLQTAYKSSGPHGKAILSAAYDSVGIILASSQVAGAS